MKTIFLSVQTGMVARDLLRCGPLAHVLCHPDARVVLLTPGARDPAFVAEFADERVAIVPLEPYAPTPMVWRLMGRRWRHARSPVMADAFHRLEQRLIPTRPAYARLFAQYAPALVVSGDPLRPGDANLMATARRHGTPSLGSVRSWDNVLKHLRTRPDALTVWNAINAREAVEVDRFRPNRVTQVGAPQLDVYFAKRASRITRESLGLDPDKKMLLLATSSFTYDSDQTYLVDMLLAAIREGDIRHPLQIVLRLHPDDKVGRYLKYRHAPEIILDIPERYLATLGWTMTQADLERMAALVRHADIMVNFATTVTLEAAVVDTPTLLVAFSPIDPDEMQRYVVGLHFRMHYRSLVERDLVPVAWDRDQLVSWVNRYLDEPSLYRTQRAAIASEWVQFTDGQSGQRLGESILRHAGLELSPDLAGASDVQCVRR
ncbi:MAG: CDP-glycerol glycerophosphotransferase family protein [Chloroflexi bacterium]|nr:CDP-glycerol glycerophosphotransferase family protein [Chloroflexota bacterium]